MFFTIRSQVFSSNSVDIALLNKIWAISYGQHIFLQSDHADIEATEQSAWYQQLSETDKKIHKESVVNSLQMSIKSESIKISIGEDYTPLEAYQILNSPLKIVLENSMNDSKFLISLFQNFKNESKEILDCYKNRQIQYTLGGGSSIEQVIKTEMSSFDPLLYPKNKNKYIRFFVLLDSDRTYPNEPLKSGTEKLINFLQEHEIPFHVLYKREMENYIPDESINKILSNKDYISAYLRLTPEQKDYFDIEKGFPNKNWNQLDENIKKLYENISDTDKKIFRANNLKRLNNSIRDDFKSEFPNLFNSPEVTKQSLNKRTEHQPNPNELTEIILKIRELL